MSLRESFINRNTKTNINKLIPHSMYNGTADFYKEKLGERLPEHEYDILELQNMLSKIKINDEDNYKQYIDSIREQAVNVYNSLMGEFNERENIVSNQVVLEKHTENLDNFFIAK